MEMYRKFLVMVTMATVSLLFIFSHLDWRRDQYEAAGSKSTRLVDHSSDDEHYEMTEDNSNTLKSGDRHEKHHRQESSKFQSPSKSSNSPGQEDEQKMVCQRTGKPFALHHISRAFRRRVIPLSMPQSPCMIPMRRRGPEVRVSISPEKTEHMVIERDTTGDYPAWFTKGWSRTATAGQRDVFVGDKPLFPACTSASSDNTKYKFIEPKKYLSNSKNPCWFEDPMKQKSFRCIPYFYVAGVAKCGTTDLYRRLRMHQDIMKGTMKEYHFWDRERFGNVEINQNGEVASVHRKPWTFKQYTDALTGDRDLSRVKDDLKYSGNSTKIFGDGSPSYLWDILNWRLLDGNQGCKEPRVVIGQHIRHIYPASKMILIFRHPTPRLYSRFLSRIWRTDFLKGATSETFHNYVVKGVRMYRDCFKRWSIRHCAYNSTIYENAVVRLVEGMYPVFMADWLRIWPRDQMLLLRNEDYGANLTETLEKAFDFLEVGPLTEEAREAVKAQQLVNVGAEYDKVGPMKPETARILDDFYQPFVQQFAEMLQDPRFLWKDTYPPPDRVQSASDTQTEQDEQSEQTASDDVSKNVEVPKPADADADKPLPLWAKLLLQIRPSSQLLGSKTSHQNEETQIMRIEKAPGVPIKKAQYPAWWVKGWPKSATSGLGDQFLGDQPFFAPCTSKSRKIKTYNMLEPRIYTESTKNPCWFKEPQLHDSVRCLPYFYIAGVAKSGSSDLVRRLRLHPDIMRGSMKEYHWWDRGRFGDFYSDDLPIKAEKPEGIRVPFKQYADMISGKQGITAVIEDLNKTRQSAKVFGDNSPSYFNDVKFWPLLDGNQGCNEPRVTIAQHIRHMTPNAKIIVVVRHPTPRAYLRFLARVPEKVSVRKAASFAFHRLVKKSVNMYKACFDHWSVRHCAYNTTLYEKDKVKLWEGMYSVFLWDWLRVFPRKQIQVIRYRDLIRDTRTVIPNLFRFLELPPLNETAMRSLTAEKWLERREEHELKKYFGAMVPETVDMLNDFYEPFVDKFAETLNDERFLWRDSDHL